jgi:hypothetical protein
MSEHPHGTLSNPDTSHETSDINVGALIWSALALAVIVIVIDAAMYGMFVVLDKIEVQNDPTVSSLAAPAGTMPPEPRLQVTPWADLKAFRTEETDYLNSYGWVDEKAGIVRVPLDKAKALLLQRGLPARAQTGAEVDATEGTAVATMGESNSGRTLPGATADTSTASTAAQASPTSPATPLKKPGGGE